MKLLIIGALFFGAAIASAQRPSPRKTPYAVPAPKPVHSYEFRSEVKRDELSRRLMQRKAELRRDDRSKDRKVRGK